MVQPKKKRKKSNPTIIFPTKQKKPQNKPLETLKVTFSFFIKKNVSSSFEMCLLSHYKTYNMEWDAKASYLCLGKLSYSFPSLNQLPKFYLLTVNVMIVLQVPSMLSCSTTSLLLRHIHCLQLLSYIKLHCVLLPTYLELFLEWQQRQHSHGHLYLLTPFTSHPNAAVFPQYSLSLLQGLPVVLGIWAHISQ